MKELPGLFNMGWRASFYWAIIIFPICILFSMAFVELPEPILRTPYYKATTLFRAPVELAEGRGTPDWLNSELSRHWMRPGNFEVTEDCPRPLRTHVRPAESNTLWQSVALARSADCAAMYANQAVPTNMVGVDIVEPAVDAVLIDPEPGWLSYLKAGLGGRCLVFFSCC